MQWIRGSQIQHMINHSWGQHFHSFSHHHVLVISLLDHPRSTTSLRSFHVFGLLVCLEIYLQRSPPYHGSFLPCPSCCPWTWIYRPFVHWTCCLIFHRLSLLRFRGLLQRGHPV